MKVRTGYLVKDKTGIHSDIFVDSQDKEEVYYIFHVFLLNPDINIYVCFNDGTKQKIVLEDKMKVIRDDLEPIKFTDIKIGEAFFVDGLIDIYMKTAYNHDVLEDSTKLTSNCVNLKYGTYYKCDLSANVFPVNAKIVIER